MAFEGRTIVFDFDKSVKFKEKTRLKELIILQHGQIAYNLNKKVLLLIKSYLLSSLTRVLHL